MHAMTRLPNFLIIGAAKSGTSSLYYWLRNNPDIHLSTPKEPHFFEDEYERGTDYYWETYFADGWRGQRLIGEVNPAHLFLPYVPSRIRETVPDARLVAILRNPVERAFSNWWMHHSTGGERLDFDSALCANQRSIEQGDSLHDPAIEPLWRANIRGRNDFRRRLPLLVRPYIEAGHYAIQLERYAQYYSRSRICVLLYEDYLQNPRGTARRLFEFLGLDPGIAHGTPARENVALSRFSQPFFRLSHRLQLQRVLPRKLLAVGRTALSRVGGRPVMSAAARDWLRQHYEPHNRRLERFLGCDLRHWER